MVNYSRHGSIFESLDYSEIDKRGKEVAQTIQDRTGEGSDFLGWLDYAGKLPDEEIERIIHTAQHIRANYDALVVIGIGGSYLGARAVIEAINGFFPDDKFEIIYLGNTLSSTYTYQVLRHLKDKRIAVNVISKSGTTTEPAVAFRLVKERLIERFGKEYLRDAIYATTDKSKGALRTEAQKEGYTSFVIPMTSAAVSRSSRRSAFFQSPAPASISASSSAVSGRVRGPIPTSTTTTTPPISTALPAICSTPRRTSLPRCSSPMSSGTR